MKKINAKKFAQVLINELEGKSEKESEKIIRDFVEYLSVNRLLSFWRDIIRSIDAAWKEKYGVSTILIKSALPLSEKSKKSLLKLSRGAEVVEIIDPELIGGAIVRIDDRIIDGSVLGALNNLKSVLTK
jgi:F-type H+-transporting ATPase subunit delta